jgi:hypothetical protein
VTHLTLADLRRVDQMDLEAENRMLRSVLGYARQCIVREYPAHPQKGLKQALLDKIDTALRAPEGQERPAEQILEERFPYLRDSRP